MKPALVLVALIALVALGVSVTRILPARASSHPNPHHVATNSCVDRYNSLLKSAKQALIAGDRAATVGFLEEAKGIIPVCPALQDAGSMRTPLSAENVGAGRRLRPLISVSSARVVRLS